MWGWVVGGGGALVGWFVPTACSLQGRCVHVGRNLVMCLGGSEGCWVPPWLTRSLWQRDRGLDAARLALLIRSHAVLPLVCAGATAPACKS